MERAKNLLSKGGSVSLHYAALELRMCMEAITYEKLRASARHIPPKVLETWQPPQAVKALLEYEPHTDKPFAIYAGLEKEYGVQSDEMKYVGKHRPFKLGWLRKHYNKLGGYLHFPKSNEGRSKSEAEARQYLADVISEVEHVLSANITGGSLGEVYEFQCQLCDQPIICGKHRLVSSGHVECLNPNCGAEYFGELAEDGTSSFRLTVSDFDCAKCGTSIAVENRNLRIGTRFRCENCDTRHTIVTRQWSYAAEQTELDS